MSLHPVSKLILAEGDGVSHGQVSITLKRHGVVSYSNPIG